MINPNTTDSMTQLIVAAASQIAGPGVEIVGRTSAMGPASIESHYDEALAVPGMLEIVAAERNTDAFVIACFGDPGLDAARELADVPVIGIAEAAMKAASLLGQRFSVITTLERTIGRAEELTVRYGLERQCAGIHACEIPVLDLEADMEHTCAEVLAKARFAIAQDEPDAIVLGCAGMADLPQRLSAQLGLPVLDGVAAAVLFAESLVRMGARPSVSGELAPPIPKPYNGLLSGFARPIQVETQAGR